MRRLLVSVLVLCMGASWAMVQASTTGNIEGIIVDDAGAPCRA